MTELGRKAVECALRSVGVKEDGTSNWGKWVQVYLKFCGIFFPAPWCSAFVAYKVHQASWELCQATKWPKQAYVQSVYNWAKKHSIIYDRPIAGTAFVVWDTDLKRYAHIGLIEEVCRDGVWFRAIEGNSNTTGSREGTEVVRRWRAWRPSLKCIKIV